MTNVTQIKTRRYRCFVSTQSVRISHPDFRKRLRSDAFRISPAITSILEKMRQNMTMAKVMTELEANGWTFDTHPTLAVICTHPQVVALKPITIADAQGLQRILERKQS